MLKYSADEIRKYQLEQIQIAKEKATGYYILWKGHRINISADGSMDNWPLGWCDQTQYAFQELRSIRAGRDFEKYDWRHND